ncbi:prolyl oligopeptidase family serine peptidase [Kitasatospora cineracea]|uniref:Dipeptidyl aminopeptidase/acylaminoacyl peptidase n=1 Tax=Kitasatospora cineracea TaxID=88074 RepID=A0A8G1UEA9_9ACTN|nr:prolyl oligopeptidase family serine peptidase [Kitasatospora cineracea]ROR35298.1 dipeptidyl aminopeptidase/acylaminoacyl peptidase [Kitasatospora cineracea]
MQHVTEPLPYGTWTSPLEAAQVAQGEALLEWTGFVGEEVWWTEARPQEGGRSVLTRRTADGPAPALPPGWDVRSRVIEYGGRPWLALSGRAEDGVVFTHWDDQRVYRWRPGADPVPLSPAGAWAAELRYADFAVRGAEVWCLRETVADAAGTSVVRHLVALPLDGRAADDPAAVRVLTGGHDFLSGPRIEPGGRRVAWLGWNHPAMPWDGTDLMVAGIEPDGTLAAPVRVAGGDGESVTQADWAADGSGALYAVTDPDGWWNVHRIGPDGGRRNLCARPEEFGEALWRIGLRWCLPLPDGRLAVVHGTSGRQLGLLAPDGRLEDLESSYTEWFFPATDGRRIAAVAAGPRQGRTVVLVDPDGGGTEVLRAPSAAHPEYATTPYRRTFTGPDGEPVHAHVHPPYHPEHTGPEGELPPYLVFAHGGPTSRSHLVLNQEISYFTSRGFGVVDVQYGGSTGFGRAYRERLRESWGVVDVRDCATVARALAAEGLADPERLAIRGGSAGGWTATASLAAEPGLYRAAGIYYPVLDAEQWRTRGTHDFESRYLESLIGAWPQQRARYAERSPVEGAGRIRAPFVLLQGLRDTVCPPAQAERLLALLADSAVPHSYLTFETEGHGFRLADTVVRSLEAELALYASVFRPSP